jgi:hypothetical protein
MQQILLLMHFCQPRLIAVGVSFWRRRRRRCCCLAFHTLLLLLLLLRCCRSLDATMLVLLLLLLLLLQPQPRLLPLLPHDAAVGHDFECVALVLTTGTCCSCCCHLLSKAIRKLGPVQQRLQARKGQQHIVGSSGRCSSAASTSSTTTGATSSGRAATRAPSPSSSSFGPTAGSCLQLRQQAVLQGCECQAVLCQCSSLPVCSSSRGLDACQLQ